MITHRRWLRAVGLFGLLVTIYFLTYTGQAITSDESLLFDAAHSFFQNRTLDIAYANTLRPYNTLPGDQVVTTLDSEPLQAYLSVPLLWIAAHVPGIGMMQTAWLFNIFVTALIACVLYYFGIQLGYSDNAALIVALVYGLATTAWAYSRLYFREPLFTLIILICVYGLERWRSSFDNGKFRFLPLLVAAFMLIVALLAKQASLLIVPMLLVVAFPRVRLSRRSALILLGVLAFLLILLIGYFVIGSRLGIAIRFQDRFATLDFSYLGAAAAGYLISPGASIWAFSPVLLLSFIGAYSLIRARRERYVIAVLVMTITFVVGYAILQGTNWIGGKAWGPRYMVPLVPFIAILLLPLAESILARRVKIATLAVIVGIVVQSVFVQVVGLMVPLDAYPNYLLSESIALCPVDKAICASDLAHQIVVWQDGVWNPLYLAPIVSADQFDTPSPIAWIANSSSGVVIPLSLLTIALSLVIIAEPRKLSRILVLSLSAGLVALLFFGMRSFYYDLRYDGTNDAAWKVLDSLDAQLQPGDTILLNDPSTYLNFFMNYYKGSESIYTLPYAPGERSVPDQPAEIETSNLDGQVNTYLSIMLARLSPKSARWWFISQYGPYSQGRLRPTEHYLAQHYYYGGEVVSQSTARLVLYDPTHAPPEVVPPWPAQTLSLDYGPATLVGFDLTRGLDYKAGQTVPISLLWHHEAWGNLAPFNYSVNVTILNSAGVTVAQQSGTPSGGFGLMTTWVDGGYYRDNKALVLPPNLAPGDYPIWVLVFDWRNSTNLSVTGENSAGDHAVIATIHVK